MSSRLSNTTKAKETQTFLSVSRFALLFICLFVSPFACLFICAFVSRFACLSVRFPVCLSVCLSLGLPVYLFVCLSVSLSVYLSVCLLVYLSMFSRCPCWQSSLFNFTVTPAFTALYSTLLAFHCCLLRVYIHLLMRPRISIRGSASQSVQNAYFS